MKAFLITLGGENYLKIYFCSTLIIFLLLLFYVHLHMYESMADKLEIYMIKRDIIVRQAINTFSDSSTQIKNLKNEFLIIEQIKGPYLLMAKSATTMWYALTAMFTLTSVTTAIFTFLIAKKGWDNITSFYFKSTFIIFLLVSTYFGIAPIVFNNKETGKFNMQKYCFFNQQQLLIYNAIKTHKIAKNSKATSLDSLVTKIDSNIQSNQDFYFDINQDKVEVDKLLKNFKDIGISK